MIKIAVTCALVLTLLASGCGHAYVERVPTRAQAEITDSHVSKPTKAPGVEGPSDTLIPRKSPETEASIPSTRAPQPTPSPTGAIPKPTPTPVRPTPKSAPTSTRTILQSTPTPTRAIPTSAAMATSTPTAAPVGTTPGQPGTPTPVTERKQTGPRSVPPSPHYEPMPLIKDVGLEKQIREFLGDRVDSYGVVIKRLSDGHGVAINSEQQFYAASLFKLLVMYEVFKQRALGLLDFDESLTLTPPYLDYQLGELRWPLWSQVPVRELLEAMITVSDNVAAIMLHDRVGGWNIIADTKGIGLEQTSISGDMPTSAGDMAALMEMIARGSAVDRESSREMIDLLSRQTINDRLPALLPEGTRVAHKTGNWDNATHDVGVVYAPSGPYVIAVLSSNPDDAEAIAKLSKLVYAYFEGDSHL